MVKFVTIVFCTQLTYSEIARARIGRGNSSTLLQHWPSASCSYRQGEICQHYCNTGPAPRARIGREKSVNIITTLAQRLVLL